MEYEVVRVQSTALFRDKSVVRPAPDIASEIRGVYERAQEWGGQIIASHTLTCAPERQRVGHSRNVPKGEPSECLFLVMELPDGYNEKAARAVDAARKEIPDTSSGAETAGTASSNPTTKLRASRAG